MSSMHLMHLCLTIDECMTYFFSKNIIFQITITIAVLSVIVSYYFIYFLVMIPYNISLFCYELIRLKNHIILYYKINKILHIIPEDIVQIIHEYKYKEYEDNVKLICNCKVCNFINLGLKYYI